jgi:hypothetical protein
MNKTNLIIATNQSTHHEWMAFACWYSLNRNLPDHPVAVVFPRSNQSHQYTWLNRCKIPYLSYGAETTEQQAIDKLIRHRVICTAGEPVVVFRDYMMAVREPNLNITGIVAAENLSGYSTCSNEEPADIVEYLTCGKFIVAEWVEKEKRHPFNRTAQLMSRNRTINEQRVFHLWRQMEIFDFLNRC